MAEIIVGDGLVVLVDDADFPLVSSGGWRPMKVKDTIYVYRKDKNLGRLYLHRVVAGAPKGMEVDHRNGNGLDNRRENLRVCTHAQNLANQRISRANTSGFKGVSWDKKRGAWEAHIKFQQKKRFLGYFATKEEAARAYNAKACELFGEYASLNQVA